jgi:hypothetical protein
MASPTIAGQYAIDGLVFGGPTAPFAAGIAIAETAIIPATTNVQDVSTGGVGSFFGGAYALVEDSNVSGVDGLQFGIDTLPGLQIQFTGNVVTPGYQGSGQSILDAYNAFAAAWNNPTVRLTAGAVSILQLYYYGSSGVYFLYGRGRQLTPTLGKVKRGVIPFVATFQAADPNFYANTPSQLVLGVTPGGGIVSSGGGGLLQPKSLTAPFATGTPIVGGGGTATSGNANNTGPVPTYPVITFYGPTTNPLLTQTQTGKTIGYNGSLRLGDSFVIDTRPWARTALLNGSPQANGLIGSGKMADFVLPAGLTALAYSAGITGGATNLQRCVIQWWTPSPGIGA